MDRNGCGITIEHHHVGIGAGDRDVDRDRAGAHRLAQMLLPGADHDMLETGKRAQLAARLLAQLRDIVGWRDPRQHSREDPGSVAEAAFVARLDVDAKSVAAAVDGEIERSCRPRKWKLEQMLNRVVAAQQGHPVADVVDRVVRQQGRNRLAKRSIDIGIEKRADIGRNCGYQPFARQSEMEADRLDHCRSRIAHVPNTRSKITSIRLK